MRQPEWEMRTDLHNMMDEGVDGVCVEGWLANKELIQDDSQGPEVHGVVVRLLLDQLRGHVQRSPCTARTETDKQIICCKPLF